MEVKELVNKFLETDSFPRCIGAIDGTHIKTKETNEHYSDYINRKGCYSINVQAVCDYRCYFLDVVMKWPGSVHDSKIFLNSSINKKLRNGEIPKREKVLVEGHNVNPLKILPTLCYFF